MTTDATTHVPTAPPAAWMLEDMERHVRWLIDTQAITTAYQPIRALATGRVVGYEALARFRGVDRGPVETIFAAAHRLGLGLDLEFTAAREALFDLPEIPGFLTINLSPQALLDPRADALLDRVPPRRLVIELTEHERITDYAPICAQLELLRARGIRIAADDVGAGFAGLRQIAELRPDIVKLDRSLVQRIATCATRRNLVAAMVAFAAAEGCRLIAEGVETREELAALGTLGVAWGQGFLLGHPMPLDKHLVEPRHQAYDAIANVIPFALWRRHALPRYNGAKGAPPASQFHAR